MYLDDLVICSDTWSSHVQRIELLFERLVKAHLTINLAKCAFAKATVTYLGHVVGQGCVAPVLVAEGGDCSIRWYMNLCFHWGWGWFGMPVVLGTPTLRGGGVATPASRSPVGCMAL